MSLLQRKPRPRAADEPTLARQVLARLGDAPWSTWSATPEQRSRLDAVLDAWASEHVPVRIAPVTTPAWEIDALATDLSTGEVQLRDPEGAPRSVPVQLLLDANAVLSATARLHRSWQARPRHAWSPWDVALAWAEESTEVDPWAGTFDLPASWRPPRAAVSLRHDPTAELPLFGWRLDVGWGARPSEHGVAVVRLTHALVSGPRHLPLFDVPQCFRRGQSPEERLRSRPLRTGAHGIGWLVGLDVADRTATIVPVTDSAHGKRPPESTRPGDTRVVPLGDLLACNQDIAELVEAQATHELRELQRRLEAHAAAGGVWVLPPDERRRTGDPTLPLTGWLLADGAFAGLLRGEVLLRHPRVAAPLAVSPRTAARLARAHVSPSERLWGDPCDDGDGRLVLLAGVRPDGVRVRDADGTVRGVPPSRFVRRNPDLVDALLDLHPDLPVRADDPDLRAALAEVAAAVPAVRARLGDALDVPVPWTDSAVARALLDEAWNHPSLDLPARWADPDGVPRLWSGTDDAGRLVFQRDPAAAPPMLAGPSMGGTLLWRRVLPPPDAARWGAGGVNGGRFDHPAAPPDPADLAAVGRRGPPPIPATVALAPWQLAFAHPNLARALHAWQVSTGWLDAAGRPLDAAGRIDRAVRRSRERLAAAVAAARGHLQVSTALKEDPRKARAIAGRLDRLEANLRDLDGGRVLRMTVDGEQLGRVGVGLAFGTTRGLGDGRLRWTDGLVGRYLGAFRLVLVAMGDPTHTEAAGPVLTKLLDQIEGGVAVALRDAVDVDEVLPRARAAILEATAADRPLPIGSLVALLTHADSGSTWLLWSGTAAAWRMRHGELTRLTPEHTADGLVALAREAGLSAADAVALLLHLSLRRTTRRELDAVSEAQLVQTAERFLQPGRRRAARAGIGGARQALTEEHARLQALLRAASEATGRRLAADPVEQGEAMLFARRLRARPGDRWILATDALHPLLDQRPTDVLRALGEPDPSRAAAWVADLAVAAEHGDDGVFAVIDPRPSHDPAATHARHRDGVYARTPDQRGVLDGGVLVPPDDAMPPLRLRPKALARWQIEVEDKLRQRKLPDPATDPAACAEAIVRLIQARPTSRPFARRPGEPLRELDEVLTESTPDPWPVVAMSLYLLRRLGIDARQVRGVRKGKGTLTAASWIVLRGRRGAWLVDPGVDAKARPIKEPVERRHTVDGWTWFPDPVTLVHVPVDGPADDDPWLRLASVTPAAAVADARPEPPLAAPTETPRSAGAPAAPAAPPKIDEGWLDLD